MVYDPPFDVLEARIAKARMFYFEMAHIQQTFPGAFTQQTPIRERCLLYNIPK